MSTRLISRYRASYGERRSYAAHSSTTPTHREPLLDQDIASPQKLGRRHFAARNLFRKAPLPPHREDSETACSDRCDQGRFAPSWTLGAAAQHIRETRPASNALPTLGETLAAPTPDKPLDQPPDVRPPRLSRELENPPPAPNSVREATGAVPRSRTKAPPPNLAVSHAYKPSVSPTWTGDASPEQDRRLLLSSSGDAASSEAGATHLSPTTSLSQDSLADWKSVRTPSRPMELRRQTTVFGLVAESSSSIPVCRRTTNDSGCSRKSNN